MVLKFLTLSIVLSMSLFAKNIYLIESSKCKVYFESSDKSHIFMKDFCEPKVKEAIVDNIKHSYEFKKRPDILSLLHENRAIDIEFKGKKLKAYRLRNTSKTRTFLSTPLYVTIKIGDKKFQYHGFISKYNSSDYNIVSAYDLVVLSEYDEVLSKEHLDIINSIPRAITVEQISTPVTYAYQTTKALVQSKKLSPASAGWDKILYSAKTYEDVVKLYKDIKMYKTNSFLVELMSNRKFLKWYSFEQKLQMLQALQENIDAKYKKHAFTIYGVLQNQYNFKDYEKDISYQIEALKILIRGYEKYKDLYINNSKENATSHWQPDMYGEVMISNFKKEVKNKKLLDEYTKLMRKLYTHARKDITYYSMQTILNVLSDEKNVHVHPYLEKVYKKRVDANKKEIYYIGTGNWKTRTNVNIGVKISAKDTSKILKALRTDQDLQGFNSPFSETFKKDMSADEIVEKTLKKYSLTKEDVEIFERDIRIEGEIIK